MARDLEPIFTDRLIFRGITLQDADFIVESRSDPNVFCYCKNPHKISLEEHISWYNTSYISDSHRFDWICIEKNTNNRIGVFGLVIHENKAEINYLLSPKAQHKGYAFEGVSGLIEYAISRLSVNHFIAEIHFSNRPSISLIEKLGFNLVCKNGVFLVYEYWT